MHGTTVPLDVGRQQSVARLEALARLMDGAFVVPGTSTRFGLDDIIGLIPMAGDVIADLSHLGSLTARRTKLADCADACERLPRHHDRGWEMRSMFCSGPAWKNMTLLRRHLDADAVRVS